MEITSKNQDKNIIKRFSVFCGWLWGRVLYYLKAGRLPAWPYKYLWIKFFFELFPEDPLRAIRFSGRYFSRKLFRESLIFLVCGPKVLKDSVQACRNVGIEPFLLFGTLRGFILRKDLLIHGHDIDVGLTDDDFQKRDLIKKELVAMGYKLTIYDDDYGFLLQYKKYHSLMIDFSRVYREGDQMVISGNTKDNKMFRSCYYPPELFERFPEVSFFGIKVRVCFDPERFLLLNYGPKYRDPNVKSSDIYDDERTCLVKFTPIP